MLVLSRKLGEVIRIGDNITVTIVAINRDKVRIGADAPREVLVMRSELVQKQEPNDQHELGGEG